MDSSHELYSCRFCAEKKKLSDLSNLDHNPEYLQNCLQKLKFLKIDSIDIFSNKLPKLICEACNDALSDAYTFVAKLKQAQIILNCVSIIKSEIFEENVDVISSIERERIEESYCGEMAFACNSEQFVKPSTSYTEDIKNIDNRDNYLEDKPKDLKDALRDLLSKNKFDKQNKIYIFDFINNETLEINAHGLKDKSFVQRICAKNSTMTHYPSIKNEQNNMDVDTTTFTEVPITNIVTFGKNNLSGDGEIQDIEDNITNFSDYSSICNTDFTGLNNGEKLFETDNSEEPNATVNSLSIFTSTTTIENGFDGLNQKTRKNSNTKATKTKKTSKIRVPLLLVDELTTGNFSWKDYTWLCQHCDTKCDSMEDLREHSKLLHSKCCGYKCVDCPEPFVTFTAFIEHVRRHRPSLRLCCHFCNEQFPTPEECTTHSYNHWFENKTCERCGEQLRDAEGLMRHKRRFRKSLYPSKYKRKIARSLPKDDTFTWENYECICQVCYLNTPDIATLRKHGEEVHVKCFVNKCIDCLYIARDFKSFVVHVLQHRPWLEIPCPYCSEPFTRDKAPMKHLRQHETEHEKVCNKCVQMFRGHKLQEHVEKFNVHGHKFSLTCDICFKEFKVKAKLTEHKKLKHSDLDVSHICDVCGRSYPSLSSFKNHIIIHLPKNNICKYCQQSFPTVYALKAHVKTHLNLQDRYCCNYCGKCYKRKSGVKFHIIKYHTSNQETFKCQYCDKMFNRKEYRRNHEFLHTGHKPYHCQKCPLSFTNWGNCNKHMIRRHGVTLAKTRRTTAGRLRVNENGQVVEVKDNVKEWLFDVVSQVPYSKKKKL